MPQGVTSSDELDSGIHITRLPEEIRITGKRYAARDELVRWSRIVATAMPVTDALGTFVALAEAVEAWGLDPGKTRQALSTPRRADVTAMRPALVGLVERTRRRLKSDEAWRSEADLALRAIRWIAQGAALLTDEPALFERIVSTLPSSDVVRSEGFYLRALVHGHQLVLEDVPLAYALRDRAARLVLGRVFAHVVGPDELDAEPTLRHPLALVEATLRGHGLLSRDGLL